MSRNSKRATLGVGLPFPFRPTSGRMEWMEHEAAVERSIVDILETSAGERVMRPGYGAGLRELVFASNTPATHRTLEDQILKALLAHEPRVTVERVHVSADRRIPNLLLIDLDYVVRRSNSSQNRVFPFYLNEAT